MSLLYLASLLFSIGGLAVLDWRYKLAFWNDRPRAVQTIAIAVVFFVLWDLAGIGLNIFYDGPSKYVTGIMLAPHFPLEEIFFLILLNYTVLIGWTGLDRRHA